MANRSIWKSSMLVLLALLLIFTSVPLSAVAVERSEARATSEEPSMLDSLLSLVSEKGADIVTSSLPTVGDFLCATVFDFVGIDYTDSYTKELKQVNAKLNEIQETLQELLKDREKQVSQNTMLSFYNNANVFSDRIYPIYVGYSVLLEKEKSGEYDEAQAAAEEQRFYEENLQGLLFGSASSTGDLYLQLKNLADTVVTPNVTVGHVSLMEHYHISYEHLWAFESQTFAPKKEFLAYVSATLLEGLVLYTFQKTHELKTASPTQTAVIQSEWEKLSASVSKATEYLGKEAKALLKKEQETSEAGTIYHYASGINLSKEMYVSKGMPVAKSNHYTYVTCRSWKGSCEPHAYSLNQRDFMNLIQRDFENYKKYYHKDSEYKVSDFLQMAGFVSDNWNASYYRGQSFHGETRFFRDEFFRFYLEYMDQQGNAQSTEWATAIHRVIKKNEFRKGDAWNWDLMAFVKSDGYLVGGYEEFYCHQWGNTGRGSGIPEMVHQNFAPDKLHYPASEERGKVR